MRSIAGRVLGIFFKRYTLYFRLMNKKLLLIFFTAFLIRLVALNQSLWLDEAITAQVVKDYSWLEILTRFSPYDFHPPLYYLLMKFWTSIFGYSEVALRMLSVLFSLATGWVIYLICRLQKRFVDPLLATGFFLFNPLVVYYSQEARMYMFAVFLLTISLFYFIKILQVITRSEIPLRVTKLTRLKLRIMAGKKVKSFIFFGLFIGLSLLTFYGSIFLIAAFLLIFLFKKNYKYFLLSTFILALIFLLISPLLYQQLVNSKISLKQVTNWSLVLGKANLKNLLLIPLKFSIGRISFYPKSLYYLVAGIWTVFVFCFVILAGLKNKVLGFLFIFPLILGFLVSFVTPLLQYFRFIYLIPMMAIFLSVKDLGRLGKLVRLGILGGFLIFSLFYLFNPQFHREDWKSAAKFLAGKKVYGIPTSLIGLRYYSANTEIIDVREIKEIDIEKEIVVIPYTFEIYGLNNYQKLFKDFGLNLKKKQTYRGIEIELWR
jgi:uncharacterized membrane protein